MTDTASGSPQCKAYRPERGDESCRPADPISFAVTYRRRSGARKGQLADFTPGCYRHCMAEETRAVAAAVMSTTGIEPLADVLREANR